MEIEINEEIYRALQKETTKISKEAMKSLEKNQVIILSNNYDSYRFQYHVWGSNPSIKIRHYLESFIIRYLKQRRKYG